MIQNILLVDDDPMSLLLTQEALRNNGFSKDIAIAMNGLLALNQIASSIQDMPDTENKKPDIIFLDLEMPLMSGWDFLEYYTKVYQDQMPRTQIILLTGSKEKSIYEKDKSFSAVSVILNKPLMYNDNAAIRSTDAASLQIN